jgi:hypothetical protein
MKVESNLDQKHAATIARSSLDKSDPNFLEARNARDVATLIASSRNRRQA